LNLGVRGKLFLFSLVLILAATLIAGLFLERKQRGALESRIEIELLRQARMAREMITESGQQKLEQIDPLADRLGHATASRITVIAHDGRVLGESKLSPEEIQRRDNHGSRPEILDALKSGMGVYRRHSDTLDADMLYVAIPYGEHGHQGTIRAAMPLAEVDKAISDLRFNLFVAGLLGLLGVFLIGGLSSHLLTRRLRDLIRHARSISKHPNISADFVEEDIQSLAGSFDQLAQALQRQVDLLADERDLSDTIINTMSEALFALDENTRISLLNRAADSLFDFDKSPLGRELSEATGEPLLGDLVERVAPDKVTSVEFTLEAGEQRHLLAKAASQRSGRGCVVVIHDITEIRRMERMNREFIANASHELRTPVTVIRANAELLADGIFDDGPTAKKLLTALDHNAERLANILSDLLNLARLDARKHQVSLKAIPLAAIANSVVTTLQPVADSKQIALELKIPAESHVLADAGTLEQILSNLLENAIKFTPEKGRVWITQRSIGNRVQTRVHDNGPGIPEEHRSLLFQRFYRVDTGRSRSMGGTGLGLAIVKDLAGVMKGRVGMEPGQPDGSIFWIELQAP